MSGIRRRVFLDSHEGKDRIVIESTQDVEPILETNRILMNAEGSGTSSLWKGRQWVRIASIPNVLIEQWMKQGLNFYDPNDWPILKRLINDAEFQKIRTAPGRF